MTRTSSYLAEIAAEGAVYGREEWVRVVLATRESPYVRPIARWLSDQALRIAARLDPQPRMHWCPRNALRPVPDVVSDRTGDVPARLREWAESRTEQRAVIELLKRGDPFALTASDHTGMYTFALRPVPVAATPPPPPPGRALDRWQRSDPPLKRQVPVPLPH
ncbi:hypothetical protein ACFWPV_28370 [Streptomyces uncialis]|uniref:hypothetical protein n=1 Tax=Streptomyces uncialis TaxID=1048205 RepID=UPI0036540955